MSQICHPLLALIASATDNELAKYVEFLKEENQILRARVPGQIYTKPGERTRLVKLGKALGQAIEELITLVATSRRRAQNTMRTDAAFCLKVKFPSR